MDDAAYRQVSPAYFVNYRGSAGTQLPVCEGVETGFSGIEACQPTPSLGFGGQFDLSLRQTPISMTARPEKSSEANNSVYRHNRKRRWQPPDSSWDAHKKTIYELYMDDNHTLQETMAIMERTHEFVASEKMYKDRLRSWGCFKNLKKDHVRNIVQQTNTRRGRQTEVLVGGRKVAMDKVQRSFERQFGTTTTKDGSESSDLGIVVRTPEDTSDVCSKPKPHHTMGTTTIPFLPLRVAARSPLDVESFQTDGRGLCLDEILHLRDSAMKKVAEGKLEGGILNLKAALSGLQDIFISTHPLVIETAWSLVKAYAPDELPQSDEVMNWISRAYSKDLGLWHPRTLLHYLRVLKTLQSFNRFDEARSFAFRHYVAVRDRFGPEKTIPVAQVEKPRSTLTQVLDMEVLGEVFVDQGDDTLIAQQINLAKIWSASGLPGMERILHRLITRFDSSTSTLRARAIDVRCSLISFLTARGDCDAVTAECKLARDHLAKLVKDLGASALRDLLRLSRELAALHVSNCDLAGCNKILRWTSDTLQRLTTIPSFRRYNYNDIQSVIDHLVLVGLGCRSREGWEGSRPWFERALGLSVKMLGPFHSRSLDLQRALKTRIYPEEPNINLYSEHLLG